VHQSDCFLELESAMRAYRDWFGNRTRFLPNRVATRTLTRLNEERPDAAPKPFQRVAAEGRNRSARLSPSVTALLNAMIDNKPQRLVVDLSSVTYIDSSGLAALIAAMQRVEGYGGKFLLAGLQGTICDIFEHLRLDQVFQVFPDAAAALAAT
jgi:anti-sigma B factor antagonist